MFCSAWSCSASARACRSRCSAVSASFSSRARASARRATSSVRRASRTESSTHATPTQAMKPACVAMKRAAPGWSATGWAVASSTYAAVATTTAAPVTAGRKRNAAVIGITKYARRTCENAPPENAARRLIATTSTTVAESANVSPTGRACTQTSTPALHTAKSTSATTNAACSAFGFSLPCPSATRAIAGSRSQATMRSDSEIASLETPARTGRAKPRCLLDQAPPHRDRDGGGAVGNAELVVQVLRVRLHGREPEVELGRDLGEALPRGDQVEDLLLARRQGRRVALPAQADLRDEPGGDVGRDDVLAARAREHRVRDLLASGLLRDEPGRAGLERLVDDAAVGERRDDEDARGELLADDGVRDRDAVELRQLVVEERHVGPTLLDLRERRPAVAGLGDDLDLPAREQPPDDALAIERVVVGAGHGAPLPLLGHGGSGHRTPPIFTRLRRAADPANGRSDGGSGRC